MYPRRSPTTHTEQLGDEASVYDWARAHVHALNPTAARVWRSCDGATSPDAIAAALRVELDIPEADAVVDLTLTQLARVHLLELPVAPRGDRPARTRRWLLGRGVAAAMLPAIYSIVAPTPVEAQSLPAAAPTLTSISPNQDSLGTTVAVTLTGTNFVIGATTVTVASGGVTAANVVVSSATSLTVDIVIAATATPGAHAVTVTTARGTSAAQTFTVSTAAPTPVPTLTSVAQDQGVQNSTVRVTLTGTNFVVGATTVTVSGTGVTVNSVVVGSTTSLTANIVIDQSAATGARTVTVTTAGGTSGGQTFTIVLPAPSVSAEGQIVDMGNAIDLAYDTSLISGGAPIGWGTTCERYTIGATAPGCYRWRSFAESVAFTSGIRLTFDFVLVATSITGDDINTIATCKSVHEIDGTTVGTLGSAARCFRIFLHNEGTYYRWIFTLGEDSDSENIQKAWPLSAPGIAANRSYRIQVDYDIGRGRSRFLVDGAVVLDVDEATYFAVTKRRMPKSVAHQINGQSQSSFGGLNTEFLIDNVQWIPTR